MSEPDGGAEYSADFKFTDVNTGKTVVCDRESCGTKVFPPGTEMFYLHSNKPGIPGRKVCEQCYRYYRQKTTTKCRGIILFHS